MKNNKKLIFLIIILILILLLGGVIIKNVFYSSSTKVIDKGEKTDNDSNSYSTNKNYDKETAEIESDGDVVNNSSQLQKEFRVGNLIVKNISIVSHSDNYDEAVIKFDVSNESLEKVEGMNLSVNFYDKENNLTNSIVYSIGDVMPSQTITVEEKTNYRIIDTYTVTITEAKMSGL